MSSWRRCNGKSLAIRPAITGFSAVLGMLLGAVAAQAATAPRTAQAKPLPPKAYSLDATQSSLGFTFEQAGARVQGRFKDLRAALSCRSQQPGDCKLTVDVVVNSVDTQDKDRDALLRGALLFDVLRFPVAHFVSQKLDASSVAGLLTIRDRSRAQTIPLALRFASEGGRAVAWLTGEFPLNRLDFGVGQGEWASTESVANAVTVKFRLRLVAMP